MRKIEDGGHMLRMNINFLGLDCPTELISKRKM